MLTWLVWFACKDAPTPDSGPGWDTDIPLADACPTTFTYAARGAPEGVALAGSFNGWDTSAHPLAETTPGTWSITVDLPPGEHTYKLVEKTGAQGRNEEWACDPEADYAQCDAGYTWNTPSCGLGEGACNSLVVVPNCARPQLAFTTLDIDRAAGGVQAEVAFTPALDGAALDTLELWVDGALHSTPAPGAITLTGLSPGRHTVRVKARDTAGRAAEELHLPFWTDGRSWNSGLMYFVFVDRFANGDPGNDGAEGTTDWTTDYHGGDWQGVLDRLDYLDSLGVTALWLTAPWDNPAGAWGDKCGADFSGYHGYWPAHPTDLEEHFGDEALLRTLIAEAHARGMRVLVDWVANHVHEDHPYAANTDWFNSLLICQGDVWNTAPEVCWFDSFLPDLRYYEPEPLVQLVDDAIAFAKDYDLDGFRVDAVKHMPHSVYFNLQSRVRAELEHRHAGGDEEFYTVGETFSGDRGLIGSYVNEHELDAQFDFGLYWAILAAFARDELTLPELESTFADSRAAYDPALMSNFLGNHDVERFITHANGEVASLYGDGTCGGDGRLRSPASPPSSAVPYERLQLAWTWLLTHEGLPLIYYGDEIGLEGFADPDNRHDMRFDAELSANEARVLAHVQALGQARLAHPALSVGTHTIWWEEADVLAWARVAGSDQALVVVNRSGSERTLSNSLGFAGLGEGRYEDVLTGEQVSSSGGSLSVTVPARGSRVFVRVGG